MLVEEERLNGGLTVVKNAEDVFLDEQAVDEAATEHGIGDLVPHAGLVSLGCEDMAMNPEPIGPAFLVVREVVRRVPVCDFTSPAEGNTVNPEAIIDERSLPHGDGGGSQD